MSLRPFRTAAALACACVAVLAACEGATGPKYYTGPVDSLKLSVDSTNLFAGDTLHVAVQTFGQGVLQSGQPRLTWTSSEPTVATVDAGGLIRGLHSGLTTIRAATGSQSAAARIRVVTTSGPCAAGGITHRDTASGTWRAADGPHRFAASVLVPDALTIEAGTLVCGGPGATLGGLPTAYPNTPTVTARGTAAAPIIFTAADPQRPWGGLRGPGHVQLSHVLIEHADSGVVAATLTMDSSVVRQVGGPAISALYSTVTLTGVTIDTAGSGIGVDWGNLTLSDVVVRHVTGTAVSCGRFSWASIHGLHVEDSGTGLFIGWMWPPPCTVSSISRITLLRNGALGSGGLSVLGAILQQPGAADSVHGNTGPWSIEPWHDKSLPGDVTVPPGVTWSMQGDGTVVQGSYPDPRLVIGGHGTLRLSPGSRLTLLPGSGVPTTLYLGTQVRLEALGTADSPVTIDVAYANQLEPPAHLGGQPGLASILSHVNLIGLGLAADSGRPILLDSSRVTRGRRVELRAAGSRIVGSTIEGTIDSVALILAADSVVMTNTRISGSQGTGVRITAPGVLLDSCEVSGSATDGIVATVAPSAGIHHCNLLSNAGVGIRNLAPDLLDARLNWWGDPAGPTGPAGDGVAGNVDASGWLTGPVGIGAAPPAVTTSSARTAPARSSRHSRAP